MGPLPTFALGPDESVREVHLGEVIVARDRVLEHVAAAFADTLDAKRGLGSTAFPSSKAGRRPPTC